MKRKFKKLWGEAGAAIILLAVLLYITIPRFLAAAQNINTPRYFPDPQFRLAVEKFMRVAPGERFHANDAAQKTGPFHCPNSRIENVRGIEFFTGITTFNCSDNSIQSIDLTKNTALQNLICAGNRLVDLDCTKQTGLRELICYKNPLRKILFPRMKQSFSLKRIICNSCRLEELDLSLHLNLEELDCSSNRLTSLDLSQCSSLRFLSCSNNTLGHLDIANNTALEVVWCASNTITAFDLSKNPRLLDLQCSQNQFKILDLRKTSLQTLRCDRNQIESFLLPERPSLQIFTFSHNNITRLQPILDALQGKIPDPFDLRYNRLPLEDLETLRKIMKELFERGNTVSGIFYWPQKDMDETQIPPSWYHPENQ